MTITSTIGHLGALQKVAPDMPAAPKGDFWATFTAVPIVKEGSVNGPKVDMDAAVKVPLPKLQHEGEVVDEQQERPLDELFPTLAEPVQSDVSREPVPSEFGDVFPLGAEKNDVQLWDVDHKFEPRTEVNAIVARADIDDLPTYFPTTPHPRHDGTSQSSANNSMWLRTEMKTEAGAEYNLHVAQNAKSEPEVFGKEGPVEVPKGTVSPEVKSETPIGQVAPSGKEAVSQKASQNSPAVKSETPIGQFAPSGKEAVSQKASQDSPAVKSETPIGQFAPSGKEAVSQKVSQDSPTEKSETPIGQFTASGKEAVSQKASHEIVPRRLVQSEPQQVARLVNNPETDEASHTPTTVSVAEKSSKKTQIPIAEAVNGRDTPRERLSIDTRGSQDIGHSQVVAPPRQPYAPAHQFKLANESSLTIQADPDTIGNGFSLDRTYGPSASTAPLNVPPHQQASVAASVSQQISVAVGHKPDGLTEIALNPEELGSVRISVKTHEGSVVLIIAAERAETQELMRKNIEALSQEFKGLGFTDIGFQFQGHGQGRERGENAEPENSPHQVIEIARETVAAEREQIAKDGLDLRL